MRYFTLVMLFIGLAGCASTEEDSMKHEAEANGESQSATIIHDVEQAIAEKDYRLWAGRCALGEHARDGGLGNPCPLGHVQRCHLFCRHQSAVQPPSINRDDPVTIALASEAR